MSLVLVVSNFSASWLTNSGISSGEFIDLFTHLLKIIIVPPHHHLRDYPGVTGASHLSHWPEYAPEPVQPHPGASSGIH
ncbi:hypothetical protein O5623_17650 [Escherichia coli]|nr:hypothetical protein [Escherichia coli]